MADWLVGREGNRRGKNKKKIEIKIKTDFFRPIWYQNAPPLAKQINKRRRVLKRERQEII